MFASPQRLVTAMHVTFFALLVASAPPLIGASLFVALEIPEELHGALSAAQLRLRASGADVLWEPAERFHLTLLFAGELNEDQEGRLRDGLRRAAATRPPFTLSYRGVGSFPHRRRPGPRVLWARPRGDLDRLAALHELCREALDACGGRKDDYPFTPHVTLGRVRSLPSPDAMARALKGLDTRPFGHHRVGTFALLRSTADGSPYDLVERFVLGGDGGERKTP